MSTPMLAGVGLGVLGYGKHGAGAGADDGTTAASRQRGEMI